MSKSKIYIVIILLLVVCNGILGFLLFSKPGPPGPPGPPPHHSPKEIIAEELHFSQDQIDAYAVLIDEHKNNIKAIDDELREMKNSLFTSILQDNSELAAEEVADQIANTQKKIELLHVQHLLDIKALCTPDQLDDFDALVKDFGKIFAPPHKKKP